MENSQTELFGGDRDPASEDKNQQLREAVYRGDLETVERLLHEGADVNNIFFGTPLICLASMIVLTDSDVKNRLAIVKTLVEHGADVNVVDDFGRSPLDWAAWGVFRSTREFKDILESGARRSSRSRGNT